MKKTRATKGGPPDARRAGALPQNGGFAALGANSIRASMRQRVAHLLIAGGKKAMNPDAYPNNRSLSPVILSPSTSLRACPERS